jgi:hypothetical protein
MPLFGQGFPGNLAVVGELRAGAFLNRLELNKTVR